MYIHEEVKQQHSHVTHQLWLEEPATKTAIDNLLAARARILQRASAKAANPVQQELSCRLDLVKALTIEQIIAALKENKYDTL